MATEAEAQAGAGFFGWQTYGGKHVRWFDGSRGTGGSGGAGQTLQVERNEEGFAFDAGKNDVRRVGSARCSATVHARLRNAVQQTLLQFVAKGGDAPGVCCETLAGDFCGFAESHNPGDVFCTGAEAALVMSAVQKLPQARSAADIQGADSLWRVQFVAREGEEIDSQCSDIDGDFSAGLHGVGVEVHVSF